MSPQCDCASLRDQLWQELADIVTERHGFNTVTYKDVVSGVTQREHDHVRILARLSRKPRRDIYDTLAAYCHILTPKEEFEQIFENEIVPLQGLVK